jgi:putative acyl-CoA dehydrogenase
VSSETHDVFNQPPPLVDYDTFAADQPLRDALARGAARDWAVAELHELGVRAGSEQARQWGDQANANPPQLKAYDRYGHRVDRVEYHPAYHELMGTAIAHGLHAWPWADDRPGAHAARAAKFLTWYTVDSGHTCPISMTYAVLPALRHQPELADEWEPGLTSRRYDGSFAPAGQKAGVTCGMGMTEKQGGSDVRANTTTAAPLDDGTYAITGHKWFCSAPMSDAFLVLAQAPGGLTCFLVPRWRPDDTPNTFRIQRLKDKLGDRSNASSEVEFAGTFARVVGEEGRGVRTIIEMVNHTRLDCSLGSTAIMRRGVVEAIWHARHRTAFGKPLSEQPLMRNVLADLAIESEAATTTVMWLADLFDAPDGDERAALLQRLALPIVKYWTCKRAPVHAAEALECLGGAGYVEESGMPRLFRQSPLNGIWEGSGNVICLDVLRAMVRSPESVDALFDELTMAAGHDRRLDEAVEDVSKQLADLDEPEWAARRLVENLALALQGSLLVRFGDAMAADVFCATRLAGDHGRAFGSLPVGTDATAIMARHAVEAARSSTSS